MSDEQIRWLDVASDASDHERRLLRSDDDELPPAVEAEVWSAIAARLPTPPGDGAPQGAPEGGHATATGAAVVAAIGKGATLPGLKLAAVAAALVGLSAGGRSLYRHVAHTTASDPAAASTALASPASLAPPPAAPARAGALAASTEATGAAVATPEVAAPEGDARPAPGPNAARTTRLPASKHSAHAPSFAAPPNAAPVDAVNRLEEEGRALNEARDALRSGDRTRAERLLEAARSRFPSPALAQERDALAVETLWASGRRDEASARAREFLRRYPTSPYSARVRSFAR